MAVHLLLVYDASNSQVLVFSFSMSSARGVENIKTIYDLIFFRSDVTVTFEDGLFPLVYFLAFNLKVTKDTDFAKTP